MPSKATRAMPRAVVLVFVSIVYFRFRRSFVLFALFALFAFSCAGGAMAIITIPPPPRMFLVLAVLGGFVFAAARHAFRAGKNAITGMQWHRQKAKSAIVLHFGDGREEPAVIVSTYCSPWFAAIRARAGKKKYFVAAAFDGTDSFRLLRMHLLAFELSGGFRLHQNDGTGGATGYYDRLKGYYDKWR